MLEAGFVKTTYNVLNLEKLDFNMNDWTAGYVADIDYTFGYYRELNPLRVRLAFLNAGLRCPKTAVSCELGFGQGVSANIHAATTTHEWYGTDFNPAQAAFAQELSEVTGAKAQFFDQSFSEFCNRNDLPEFDYIGLHGIWSWISDENRKIIVDFVRRKLKVGGVLYLSYNTQPGWASFLPMRNLLKEYSIVNGSKGQGIVKKVENSLDFAIELLATEPKYLQFNPQAKDKIDALKKQDKQYLAHEYFNQDWHPLHFSETHELLKPAKMSFACSAEYLEHVSALNMTPDQQIFLATQNDPGFKESIRDFMCNQQFRRDYWVKGPRRLVDSEKIALLKKERVVLTRVRSAVSLKVNSLLGEAEMNEALYSPVLDFLQDHKPKTLEQIYNEVYKEAYEFGTLLEIVMVLAGAGYISTAQDADEASKAKKLSDKINKYLLTCDNFEGAIAVLACPLIGGAVPVNRFQKMFLFARSQGLKTSKEWAEFAWAHLDSKNQKLVVDGEALVSDEDNIKELEKRAKIFQDQEMPMLKALLVI